jgi:hypothetical protein
MLTAIGPTPAHFVNHVDRARIAAFGGAESPGNPCIKFRIPHPLIEQLSSPESLSHYHTQLRPGDAEQTEDSPFAEDRLRVVI